MVGIPTAKDVRLWTWRRLSDWFTFYGDLSVQTSGASTKVYNAYRCQIYLWSRVRHTTVTKWFITPTSLDVSVRQGRHYAILNGHHSFMFCAETLEYETYITGRTNVTVSNFTSVRGSTTHGPLAGRNLRSKAVDRWRCLVETPGYAITYQGYQAWSSERQLASRMAFGDQISVTAKISSWRAYYQCEDKHDKIKGKEEVSLNILKSTLFMHITPFGPNSLTQSCTYFKGSEIISEVAVHLHKHVPMGTFIFAWQ